MTYIYTLATLWVGIVIGVTAYLVRDWRDPTLDACAREHNVYACEYVPQPVRPALLPPPPTNEGEDK